MRKTKKKTPKASRESADAASINLGDAEQIVSTKDSNQPFKNKIHAVELALEKLGSDAMPARIHDHLLDAYGLDMSPAHIGVNKTTILRRLGVIPDASGKARRTVTRKATKSPNKVGRPRKTDKPVGYSTPASSGASFTADDIRTVKMLLGSYDQKSVLAVAKVVGNVGADKFRELVEVVG